METSAAFRRLRKGPPSTPVTTPDTAIRSSFLNQVLLHDWWLIRADSDSHGKQIGIGGFAFREGTAARCFSSAPIVKRQDAVTLKTVDGITIMVLGSLNKIKTLENGFSHEVCDHFLIGFPYYWEEFADLSVGEERAGGSKGVSCADTHTTTSPGYHGTDTLYCIPPSEAPSGKKENLQPIHGMVSMDHKTTSPRDHGTDTFDSTPSGKKETQQQIHNSVSMDHCTTKTKKKKRESSNVESVIGSGPWTRSRARRARISDDATNAK